MISDNILILYLVFADMAEAKRIGRALVEEKLVACINILPGIHSIYHTEDVVAETMEVAAIATTRADEFDTIRARVQSLHSYDTPCILSWKPAKVAESYQGYIFSAVPE